MCLLSHNSLVFFFLFSVPLHFFFIIGDQETHIPKKDFFPTCSPLCILLFVVMHCLSSHVSAISVSAYFVFMALLSGLNSEGSLTSVPLSIIQFVLSGSPAVLHD
ncbi:hypothetical protein XENORESO_006627 [Xenotaenia resolanae]|uniref:Uncharacterized protein n=1 Tax=Xenotaenia resolanae TaxID=208358 RepID=A0ABV0X2V4_9TELE